MTQKIWRDSVWIAKSAWRGDDFSNTGKQIKKSEPFMTRSDKAMSSGYLEQQQNHKTRSQHRPSIQDLITSCDQQQKCHPKEQTGFRKYFAHRGNGNILQQPSATISHLVALWSRRGVTALIFQRHFKVFSGYRSSLFSSNHHMLKQKTDTELRKYMTKLTVKKKRQWAYRGDFWDSLLSQARWEFSLI